MRDLTHEIRRGLVLPLVGVLALSACGGGSSRGGVACGLAAVVGPSSLLNEFGVPQQTLGEPPGNLPGRLVVRIVAGPTLPAIVGRVDSSWMIGVDGPPPPHSKPGFGVLVLDPSEHARGVMIYEGRPVNGAPRIGSVSFGTTVIPLIGIQADPTRFEDPRCPFFPDSVLR